MGYTYNLMQGLIKLRNNDFCITFNEIDISYKLNNSSKISYTVSRCIRKIKTIKKFCNLKRIIRKSYICIFQGYQNKILSSYARKQNKIIIYMPHSPSIMADEKKMMCELSNKTLQEKEYNTILHQEEKLIKNADYLVFPSLHSCHAYTKQWNALIKTKQIHYIKSGTIIRNSNNLSHIQINNTNKLIIAFIGRYVTHKGFDLFCEAADSLSNDERLYFICAGDGPLKTLIPQNVHNLGFVENIGAIIKQCNLIVIANKITYYDLLPIECAAYGIPLIFSDNGGNIDQAEEFSDSLVFKTNSSISLAESIKEAANKIKIKPTWGKTNKTKYLNEFTEIKFAQRWIDFINKVISEEHI